jgi:hypothetical protein
MEVSMSKTKKDKGRDSRIVSPRNFKNIPWLAGANQQEDAKLGGGGTNGSNFKAREKMPTFSATRTNFCNK